MYAIVVGEPLVPIETMMQHIDIRIWKPVISEAALASASPAPRS